MNGYRPPLVFVWPTVLMFFMAATSVWNNSVHVLPANRGSVTTTVLVGLGGLLPALGWLAHENHERGRRIQRLEDRVRSLSDAVELLRNREPS